MGAAGNIWNATEVAETHIHDIPSSSLTVNHLLSLPEMKPRILELFKDLFKQWSNLDESKLSLETITGGITNLLLKVSVRENDGSVVSMTVRLYGPNTEYVINRERELQAMPHLSAAGFGAKLLGVFGNGMVQSFIEARTLTPQEMGKLAPEIAKQLRKFHEVQIPGSKEPQLWNDISKFVAKASTLKFEDDSEKQKQYENISFDEINKEITDLKVMTDRFNAPVVYCHNDLLSGNLMLDEEGKLYFIDFEYGSYSFRGFDIGNHFNEYAGYFCDYTLYPSKEDQYIFFRHYLRPERPDEVSDKELDALYAEANTYMLASHLYWSLWSMIQARMSPIAFDYLGYALMRYKQYKACKDKNFSLAESYFSTL